MQHVPPVPRARRIPSADATPSSIELPARRARGAGAWKAVLSSDGCWALVYDAQGRNLAEVHRPKLSTGPLGRSLCFAQVVALMRAAPELCALLQESVAPDGIGPHEFSRPGGYRDRVLAVLDRLALPADA